MIRGKCVRVSYAVSLIVLIVLNGVPVVDKRPVGVNGSILLNGVAGSDDNVSTMESISF